MTALDCERYHALPYSGGVLDQPAGMLRRMREVVTVYEAFIAKKNSGSKAGEWAKWRKENEAMYHVIEDINRLRKQNGSV